MQLSTSTSPADPTLAALLLGNFTPLAATPDAAGPVASGFASLLAEAVPGATPDSLIPETAPETGEAPEAVSEEDDDAIENAGWPFAAIGCPPPMALPPTVMPAVVEYSEPAPTGDAGLDAPATGDTGAPIPVRPWRPKGQGQGATPELQAIPARFAGVKPARDPGASAEVPTVLAGAPQSAFGLELPDDAGGVTGNAPAEASLSDTAGLPASPTPSQPRPIPVSRFENAARDSVIRAVPYAGIARVAAEDIAATVAAPNDGGTAEMLPTAFTASAENTLAANPPTVTPSLRPAANVVSAYAAVPSAKGAVEAPMPPEQTTAKIAVSSAGNFSVENKRQTATTKNSLTIENKLLTKRESSAGTDVANLDATMPPAASFARPTPAEIHSSALVTAVQAPELREIASPAGLLAPDPVSTAHRAVETVLAAAHRVDSAERHTVNLQFSVGGSDLNVRVELFADEVRATFRTDSPELRAALSHEWQAAQAASSDRPMKLVAPVFAAHEAGGFDASTGGQAQRDQRGPQTPHIDQPFLLAGLRGGAKPAAFESSATAAPRASLHTVRHLHTLA